jgi:arsenate reductase (glutaredoxin)
LRIKAYLSCAEGHSWFEVPYFVAMIKIYHNPQCKKSRAGLQYLKDKNVPVEIVEYLKNPLTEKQLETLLSKLNKKPSEIVRTQEEYYKKSLKGKNFNDHEWIRILLQNPRIIMRPIIEKDYKAVIGDPVENIDLLLK